MIALIDDPAGNRTIMNDRGTVTTFTYSNANRLTLANANGVLTTYTNDPAGNRTSMEQTLGTSTYTTMYTWDAAGNMTVAEPPSGTVTFTYNAMDQRVLKDTGSVSGYLYDHKKLLAETDGEGGSVSSLYTTTTDQEYGDLIDEDGGDATHLYDAQANTNAMLDVSGNVVAQYKYYAFGNIASYSIDGAPWSNLDTNAWNQMSTEQWTDLTPPEGSTKMLAGGKKQYFLDEETSLYMLGMGNNQGRSLDSSTARLTSEDPIRQAGGDVNLYPYVASNPVDKLDPSGHDDKASFNISPEDARGYAITLERDEYELQNSVFLIKGGDAHLKWEIDYLRRLLATADRNAVAQGLAEGATYHAEATPPPPASRAKMKMDLPLAIYNGLSGGKFGFLMQNDPFDESPITDEEKWDRSFAASADAFNRTGLTAAAHTVHGVAKGAANTATSGGKQIAILGALGAAAPEAAWAYIILSLVKWGVHAASMRAQAGQTPLQIAGGTAGDLTGASGVWAMLRNKDIADQHNLNLTWEQRGEAGGEGVPQLAASGFGIYWLRNFGSNSRSLSRRPNIGYGLINEDLLAQLEPSQSKRTPHTLLDITAAEGSTAEAATDKLPPGVSFKHSEFGGIQTISAGPKTQLRFDVTGKGMYVDMWEVAPELQNAKVGRALFKEALTKFPEVTSIRGVAELDNLAALRKFGDVSQTPFARALKPLGFTKFDAEDSLGRPLTNFSNIQGEVIIGASK